MSVKSGPPAVTMSGVILEIAGVAGPMTKLTANDVDPEASTTVTAALSADAISPAGTVAVSRVALP